MTGGPVPSGRMNNRTPGYFPQLTVGPARAMLFCLTKVKNTRETVEKPSEFCSIESYFYLSSLSVIEAS